MDRMGLNRALAPSLAVLALGLALLAGTGRFGLLDVAAVIGGIGHGYLYPALSALVIARTPLTSTGRSSSIYSSLYDFGTMAGPYLLGIVAVTVGYGPMFMLAGAIAMAGTEADGPDCRGRLICGSGGIVDHLREAAMAGCRRAAQCRFADITSCQTI